MDRDEWRCPKTAIDGQNRPNGKADNQINIQETNCRKQINQINK